MNARDKVLVAMQRAFLVLRGRHVNNKETEALLAVAEAITEQPCREKEREVLGREVLGYRVRQAKLKRYVCREGGSWGFRNAPPKPVPKADALQLLHEVRQWDALCAPHYGFRLIVVYKKARS